MRPVVEDVNPTLDPELDGEELMTPVVEDIDPAKGEDEYIEEDGEPMDTEWHRINMDLLIELAQCHHRQRSDFYVGGNMFIYYEHPGEGRKRRFRGPDFFWVWGARQGPPRRFWRVWDEGGKYPDVIIELLSRKTAKVDRTTKKDIYEQIFQTHEYFLYDPDRDRLDGWRLSDDHYTAISPDDRGWMWSEKLGLWLGTWVGSVLKKEATWLRFYTQDGKLAPTYAEAAELEALAERQRAEAERQRAEAERQRADTALAELARLKKQLGVDGTKKNGET